MPVIIEPEGGEGIAGYTFLELQEEVLSFQFAPGKYRPYVKKWLNQAVRRAVIESEIRTQMGVASYETEDGDGTLGVPADFARLIDIYNSGTGADLTPLDIHDLDSLTASSGRPIGYTALGAEITIYPTPDAAYDIALRYWKLPEDMVVDSDVPSLPAQYHELPIAYAMKKAYLRENDYTAAQVWDAEWQTGIAKLRGEVQHEMFDGPRQVPGMWESATFPSPQIPR